MRLYNDQGELVLLSRLVRPDIEVLDLPGPDIQCISTLCAGDTACYWTTACNPPNDPNAYQWEVTYSDGSTEPFIGHEICVQWGDGPQGQLSLSLTPIIALVTVHSRPSLKSPSFQVNH